MYMTNFTLPFTCSSSWNDWRWCKSDSSPWTELLTILLLAQTIQNLLISYQKNKQYFILPYITLYFIFLAHFSYFNNSIHNCELIASNRNLPLDYTIIEVATDVHYVHFYIYNHLTLVKFGSLAEALIRGSFKLASSTWPINFHLQE